jgi:hypothetical protein
VPTLRPSQKLRKNKEKGILEEIRKRFFRKLKKKVNFFGHVFFKD